MDKDTIGFYNLFALLVSVAVAGWFIQVLFQTSNNAKVQRISMQVERSIQHINTQIQSVVELDFIRR